MDVLSSKNAFQKAVSDIGNLLLTTFFSSFYDAIWRSGNLGLVYHFLVSFRARSRVIRREFRKFKPDMVICTHSLATSVTLTLLQELDLGDVPIFVVTTDFGIHPYWPRVGVESYFVANSSSRLALKKRGVRAPIFVHGIPVRPGIKSGQAPRRGALTYYSSSQLLKVLVLAGGNKSAPYATLWPRIYTLLSLVEQHPGLPIELNVVLGNARFTRLFFENLGARPRNVHIRGYVSDMPTLLKETDVVICKPGGLIIAESLAAGLPVLLMIKGGGQEAENAKFIHSSGAGLLSEKPKRIFDALARMANDPRLRQKFQRKAEKLGHPEAADKIAVEIFRRMARRR